MIYIMMQIDLKLNEILEEVKARLGFIASKNTEDPTEYFRFTACNSDVSILYELLLLSSASLSLNLGNVVQCFQIKSDTLELLISADKPTIINELTILIKNIIVEDIMQRWLKIVKLNHDNSWFEEYKTIIENIKDICRIVSPLKCRALPKL